MNLLSLGDLPPFLKNQVDNLTWHLRFCDTQRTNPSLSSEVVANLNDQRTVLLQQMTLLNDQIRKYRVSIAADIFALHTALMVSLVGVLKVD